MALASGSREPAARRSRHIPALDGLRGVAFLLVVVHNAQFFPQHPTGVAWLTAVLGNAGWTGVQLFFVLSGFLITRQLLDSQRASNYYQVFFARRILRIFPLYYAALLIGLLLLPLALPAVFGSVLRWEQIWLWSFLFNWASALGAPDLGLPHFWSLAIEEQFYLVWPFVVRRPDPVRLVKICCGIAIAAPLIRVAMLACGASPQWVSLFTFCRMDALAIGAIVAALVRLPSFEARAPSFAPWLVPLAGALLVIGAPITRGFARDDVSTQTAGQSILAASFALFLLASILREGTGNRWLQALLSFAPLRSVGKYSYGMYVLHFPIIMGLQRFLPGVQAGFGDRWIAAFLGLVTLLSYAAAFASYHLLEKRFLALKSRFVPTVVTGPDFEAVPEA